ncbi:Wzy [Priestia megaterium]|uniref:hypothetical protein n=1 Tax=Priestia megaterium TaxID=1404 RepID=UPI0039E1401C
MINIKKSFTYVYVVLLIMIAGNTTITQLFLLVGEKKLGILSKERIILFIFISTIIVATMVSWKKITITKFKIIAVYITSLFFISLIILSFINTSEGLSKFFQVFFSYYWITLFSIVIFLNITFMKEKYIKKSLSIFILMQCILGILQSVLNKPLVFTTFEGEPVLNTIYYLNGISSASDILYSMGAKVRAFGLTDSGLTLGLLSLVLFSSRFYDLFSIDRKKQIISGIVIVIAIFCTIMTITRNIYFSGMLLALLLLYLRKVSKFKITIIKSLYISSFIVNCFFVTFASEILNQFAGSIKGIDLNTLFGRLIGYQQVLEQLKFNPSGILFGSGIVPSRQLFIDSDFLYVYANAGLVVYAVMQLIYIYILFKGLNGIAAKRYSSSFIKGIIVFLATYSFAGWVNVVAYVYLPVAILAFLIMKNTDKNLC